MWNASTFFSSQNSRIFYNEHNIQGCTLGMQHFICLPGRYIRAASRHNMYVNVTKSHLYAYNDQTIVQLYVDVNISSNRETGFLTDCMNRRYNEPCACTQLKVPPVDNCCPSILPFPFMQQCYNIHSVTLIAALFYNWGVSRKLATFGKMTVTGVYLRYLNVLLLYYPFMSNPRPCLECATQQMWSTVLHFFLVAGFVSRT